jgi:pimeloyl-ACP methyl ester carboxylesterase
MSTVMWKDAPTRTVDVGGTQFAYRELGASSAVPVIFLHHFTAVLDDWDPRVIDGIAADHRVIAKDYFARLKERKTGRDKRVSLQARLAQVKAIRAAGRSEPDDLSRITQPVLVANGDHDLMVASSHSADMARRLPNARLTIYPDSGHGGVFQHHDEFVPAAMAFLNGTGEIPR